MSVWEGQGPALGRNERNREGPCQPRPGDEEVGTAVTPVRAASASVKYGPCHHGWSWWPHYGSWRLLRQGEKLPEMG